MKRFAWLTCLLLAGCAWDKVEDQAHGYPAGVDEIMRTRCATSGCHNAQSAEAAAGLDLSTWEAMYRGSRGGSAVIPYATAQSYLLYAVNTDTARGLTLNPTMPIGGATLTDTEYELLRNWIANGARNVLDEERFPPLASRRKWYIANQGCDLVAVVDAESRQIMRYLEVGASPSTEAPHNIKVSVDGKFWYTVFLSQNPHLEKYSTLTDEKLADIAIGNGAWNTFNLSPDGKFGIAVSYKVSPAPQEITVVIVDLVNDVVSESLHFDDAVHGSCAHPTLPRFYVTKQDGNELIAIDYDAQGRVTNTEPIDLLQGTPPMNGAPRLSPHEVLFTPSGDKYFVTCQTAHEVRIYNAATNALLDVVQVGDDPVEMAVSAATGHMFISCMEDISSFPSEPNKVGSVAVIDYTTHQLVRTIYAGFQPHGMAVDADAGILVVANRNVNVNGPAPHHSTACGGRNGYLTAIDLNTLELVPRFKPELSSDPYAVAVKR